ncbi:sigma 54-interacting transcriptional regulator, partial [Candidatus Latescibacterota bacterium]
MTHRTEESPNTGDRIKWIVTPGLIPSVERFIKLFDVINEKPHGKNHILILGPTGVGKSLFCEIFMKLNNVSEENVVRVNIAAFNKEMIESELFGYVEGAFTGARTRGREGFIKKANNGILILEELGDLAPYIQAKLLTFIEDGYFYPVGSENKEKSNVQIIATTNKPRSEFRDDFWNRFLPFYIP